MEELHQIQLEILRKLLFKPNSTFTELIYGETNTMLHSYHIKTLISSELVIKANGVYKLTNKGKEYANRLDTENPNAQIEKQAKISVSCHIFKGKSYDSEMVVQTRMKEPFFGYKGGITGKSKYGETAFETAKREILEETNLTGDLHYHGVIHHINYHEEKLVEDKYFLVFSMLNAKGNLTLQGEGFINQWMSLEDFKNENPIYRGELELIEMCKGKIKEKFLERINYLDEF